MRPSSCERLELAVELLLRFADKREHPVACLESVRVR